MAKTKEKVVILIDGENFRKSVNNLVKSIDKNYYQYDYPSIKLRSLCESVLSTHENLDVIEIRYYGAKLHMFPESRIESNRMIADQRKLINNLNKQKIAFLFSGNVRRREVESNKGGIDYTYAEKGVDVSIAVDMLSLAYDKKVSKIILCSSDSDLQPAVKETKKRGTKVIYLGFGINPNKGLQASTNETILFRNQEVIDSLPKKKKETLK